MTRLIHGNHFYILKNKKCAMAFDVCIVEAKFAVDVATASAGCLSHSSHLGNRHPADGDSGPTHKHNHKRPDLIEIGEALDHLLLGIGLIHCLH